MALRTGPARKFTFDRSFDDPSKLYLPGERRKSEVAAEEAAQAAAEQVAAEAARVAARDNTPPPPPAVKTEFTKAQLEAAREEGYIAGHSAALEEAGTARDHYIADALNLIGRSLEKLDDQQRAANIETEKLAMRMTFGMISRLLPAFAEQYAVDNIEGFVRQVLPVAIGEPKVLVRAHPMIAGDLEERLKDVFARASFQGAYSVVTDYELQPGDCRLEWTGGGADRDEARIWRSIREVIAANYGDVDADALDATVNAELAAEAPQTPEAAEAPAAEGPQAAEAEPNEAEPTPGDGV